MVEEPICTVTGQEPTYPGGITQCSLVEVTHVIFWQSVSQIFAYGGSLGVPRLQPLITTVTPPCMGTTAGDTEVIDGPAKRAKHVYQKTVKGVALSGESIKNI